MDKRRKIIIASSVIAGLSIAGLIYYKIKSHIAYKIRVAELNRKSTSISEANSIIDGMTISDRPMPPVSSEPKIPLYVN